MVFVVDKTLEQNTWLPSSWTLEGIYLGSWELVTMTEEHIAYSTTSYIEALEDFYLANDSFHEYLDVS